MPSLLGWRPSLFGWRRPVSYASLGNEDLSLDELADLDGKVRFWVVL